MSTLDDLTASSGPGGMAGFVGRLSRRLRPVSRRSMLVGAAVAGSALATNPRTYALRPVTAYASICGPGNTFDSGWTVFCCTVNKGVNACPPGSFAAGWWKAADSSWCGGGYRYIVDCNASCSKCTTGCSDGICDSRCWSCSCGRGSTATCDQRRVCCNAFRYGQCNTQVKCSGGVHCRVVSCVAPYKWASCTTTSLSDNRTSEHSAPCLPQWGAIASKYRAMGEQASFLRASRGPLRSIGDGRGQYVEYQGGIIYWTSKTGAHALTSWVRSQYGLVGGGPPGPLGYPTSDKITGLRDGGWVQYFEGGAITDSASTTTQAVWGIRWDVWKREGGVNGHLGYPVAAREDLGNSAWIQRFQRGAITDSTATTTQSVWGVRWDVWQREGREKGRLGFPTSARTDLGNSAWIQYFQKGAITDSTATTTQSVSGVMYTGWKAAGLTTGVLKFPTAPVTSDSRGSHQAFQGGELWALSGGPARRVYGAVLTQWRAAGGAAGSYGYPVTDTVATADGRLTCTFEGGTITA